MAENIASIRSTERDNEIVRHLWLKSPTARTKSKSSYHIIRVGVGNGSAVDWLGEWDQSTVSIGANDKYYLSGEFPLNIHLDEGTEIVVGVQTFGSPSTLDGMSVEVKGSRVGSVGVQDVIRLDGDFPPGAEIESPLFGANSSIEDDSTREAVNGIVDVLNDSGVLDWSHTHALRDPSTPDTVTTAAIYMDRDSTGATISSGTFVDGSVSITVAVGSGKTVYTQVAASFSFEAVAAAGGLYAAIGDGTSDHNDIELSSTGTGDNQGGSVLLAQSITTDTTYTLRLKKITGTNALVEDQTITALAVQTGA